MNISLVGELTDSFLLSSSNRVATVTETFEKVRRTGKRCVWVLLENRGEMERYDWSDSSAVLAVTYGTVQYLHIRCVNTY